MRRQSALGCFAIALLLVFASWISTATAGESFDRIVFFGDSLSDPGNHFVAFGTSSRPPFAPIPDFPYAIGGHHFTNGPTWAEQLARELDLPTSGAPALRSPGVFTNYAVGRARARAGAPAFPDFDLGSQVNRFLADFGGHAPSGALYVIWIGSNDLDDALTALETGEPVATAVGILLAATEATGHAVETLYAAGGREFLIISVPDLAITPFVRSLGPDAQGAATFFTGLYNGFVDQAVRALSVLPQIHFRRFDVNPLFAQILAAPQRFDLVDVVDSCLTFGVVRDAICDDPDDFLFWDAIHPTTASHAILAGAALRALGLDESSAVKGAPVAAAGGCPNCEHLVNYARTNPGRARPATDAAIRKQGKEL